MVSFSRREKEAKQESDSGRPVRPLRFGPWKTSNEKLERARALLDGGEPTLDELAAAVGLSASHLQRKFQARYGISPAEYLAQKKLGALKSGLRAGHDVSAALYDAGYGSPSRVYEQGAARLGMTPATYRAGGDGNGDPLVAGRDDAGQRAGGGDRTRDLRGRAGRRRGRAGTASARGIPARQVCNAWMRATTTSSRHACARSPNDCPAATAKCRWTSSAPRSRNACGTR